MERMKSWQEYRGYPFVPATRSARQEFLDRFKQREGCGECGYAEHPEALDLVGVPRPQHDIRARWSDIIDWVLACEVVCANCHRVRIRRGLHATN